MAGNVAGAECLGSLDYALAALGESVKLVVVLGHNDEPAVPHMGSAIFIHLQQPDGRATEGCVALNREDMEALLSAARPGDVVRISGV